MEFLVAGSSSVPESGYTLILAGVVLTAETQVQSLGVLLELGLLLEAQVAKVAIPRSNWSHPLLWINHWMTPSPPPQSTLK